MSAEVKEPPSSPKKTRREDGQDDFDWPYEISIDREFTIAFLLSRQRFLINGFLVRKSPKPKIAFLSGMDREFYPEKPGHTRMGVEFSMNCAPGDVPNPNYYPPTIGIRKPISLLGYGIGGLLGPRFVKDYHDETPDPGEYQAEIKASKKDTSSGIPADVNDPRLRWQCRIGFGTSKTLSRFGIQKTEQPPGPGSYPIPKADMCTTVNREESFGGRRKLIPSVSTICIIDGGEKCCECGEVQMSDYYRSKRKLRHPEKKRAGILAICRKCYCKAWNGHFAYWMKSDLGRMFQKARHCNYIHDHQKLPQFIHKTTCRNVRRLTIKEVVLSKYYPDCCAPQFTQGGKGKS